MVITEEEAQSREKESIEWTIKWELAFRTAFQEFFGSGVTYPNEGKGSLLTASCPDQVFLLPYCYLPFEWKNLRGYVSMPIHVLADRTNSGRMLKLAKEGIRYCVTLLPPGLE